MAAMVGSKKKHYHHHHTHTHTHTQQRKPAKPQRVKSPVNIQPPTVQHPLVSAMLDTLQNGDDSLLDLVLVGKDEKARVKTSRFVMACRIPSLRERLFSEEKKEEGRDGKEDGNVVVKHNKSNGQDGEIKTDESVPAPIMELSLGDYSESILKALVEYCFAGDLLTNHKDKPNSTTSSSVLWSREDEQTARSLVQLHRLAASLRFRTLQDETYQMARRLMNRHLPLACAVYDETGTTAGNKDELETYALQTIADCPKEALIVEEERGTRAKVLTKATMTTTTTNNTVKAVSGVGIRFLSASRLKTLLKDPEMEGQEDMQIVRMLLRWVESNGHSAESVTTAKTLCANHVQLQRIDRIDLLTTVKKSGFVELAAIDKAIAEQKRQGSLLIQKGMDVERVIVKGAGLSFLNGLYLREQDRDNEAMYAKTDPTTGQTISLHRWGTSWGIAPDHDQSNPYYTCGDLCDDDSQVPFLGWRVGPNGQFPAPTCTWIAAADPKGPYSVTSGRGVIPACFLSEEDLYGN